MSKHGLKRVLGLRVALLSLNPRVRELERKAARDTKGIPGCVCFGQLKYFWILFLEMSGLSTQITFNPLPSHNRAPLKRKQQTRQPHPVLFTGLENELHVNGSYCGFVFCKRDIQPKHQFKTHLIQQDLLR